MEEALRVAEPEDNLQADNGEDDVAEIPQDVMEVTPDQSEKAEKEEGVESEISGPRDSSKSSSSSSSSSSGSPSPKGKAAKAKASKAKAEPKRGAGRGRGPKSAEMPPPKAEVAKKRPVPIDTSNVKINQNLKARLDQISQEAVIEGSGSASSSSKAPAAKRKKT